MEENKKTGGIHDTCFNKFPDLLSNSFCVFINSQQISVKLSKFSLKQDIPLADYLQAKNQLFFFNMAQIFLLCFVLF